MDNFPQKQYVWYQRTRSLLSERLNIDLTTHSLDEAKALGYHALSYTWGAPEGDGKPTDSDSCILVNGDRFYVQPNLFGALNRFEEFDWYLWIDAICIDQTSQREREIQVGIMSEIYSMAARVDIWLGVGGKESVEAIHLIRKLASLAETDGSEVSLDQSEIESLGLPPIPSVAWKPFVDLLERNWFRRAWVIQETVLAKQTFVFLGDSECVSWEQLASALAMIKRLGWLPNAALAMVKVERISWSPGPYAVHFITVIKMSLEKLKRPQDHPLLSVIEELTGTDNWKTTASSQLAYMMMACHKFKVTNARDRVYSLLGMVNIAASHMGIPQCDLEVDYKASVAQVFTAATKNILTHCNHLGFISLAGFAEFHHGTQNLPPKDIPSWVPNFSNEPSAARTAPILFARGNSDDRLDAARYSEIGSLGFSIIGGTRLSVQAQRIGQILPGSYQFFELAYYFNIEPFAALLLRCGKRYKPTGELSIEACWRTFIFGSNIHDPVTDSSALGGYFKAWLSFILFHCLQVCDTSMTVDQRLSILEQMTNYQSLVDRDGDKACDILPSIEWIKQMLQKLGHSPPDSQLSSIFSYMASTSSITGFSSDLNLEWTSTVAKELADTFSQASQYASLLGTYAGQRRVFLTDKGHLGLAFSSALEGDSVWVVSSCPVPLVLRPRDDGTYQLVGDSYVHGIMKGEAVKDNGWEEITIT
ncbi:hypothetical protein FOMA001_g7271 [Fusarium oxysporum f. sp. matthiolae]|nr:hypothetical protein FOMA001_g7271 [Fusarium oxysporum f. sp. matthiolae]